MRKQGAPSVSMVTPMMRPGSLREYASEVLRNPAWGPPKPMGTPKRWAEPTAMSAPNEAGEFIFVSAMRSVAAMSRPSAS